MPGDPIKLRKENENKSIPPNAGHASFSENFLQFQSSCFSFFVSNKELTYGPVPVFWVIPKKCFEPL